MKFETCKLVHVYLSGYRKLVAFESKSLNLKPRRYLSHASRFIFRYFTCGYKKFSGNVIVQFLYPNFFLHPML